MQNLAMSFFLRSPQTHLRKLSRSMSVLESSLVPAFAAQPSSYTPGRQLSSASSRFLPDFASRPVSQRSSCHQQSSGLSYRAANPEEEDQKASAGSVEKDERKLTVESMGLEPLSDKILDYFAARKISKKTLERNRVMQKKIGDEIWIAFTYWHNGEFLGCRYQSVPDGTPASVSKETPPDGKEEAPKK